jgi:hypothetical protein
LEVGQIAPILQVVDSEVISNTGRQLIVFFQIQKISLGLPFLGLLLFAHLPFFCGIGFVPGNAPALPVAFPFAFPVALLTDAAPLAVSSVAQTASASK